MPVHSMFLSRVISRSAVTAARTGRMVSAARSGSAKSFHTMRSAAVAPRAAAAVSAKQFCTEAFEEPIEEGTKLKGTCKWFDSKKGFGFITPDDGSADVFVHQTQVHAPGFRNLAEGEPLEFQTEKSEDGRVRAIQVTGPDGAYVQGAPRPAPMGRDDDWSF